MYQKYQQQNIPKYLCESESEHDKFNKCTKLTKGQLKKHLKVSLRVLVRLKGKQYFNRVSIKDLVKGEGRWSTPPNNGNIF